MGVDQMGPASALFLKIIHAVLTRGMEKALEDQPSISGPKDMFDYVRLHLGSRCG